MVVSFSSRASKLAVGKHHSPMSHEVNVKTLEGGVVTVKVRPTNTIGDLKAMLRTKKHIVKIQLSAESSKLLSLQNKKILDGNQTLKSAELLHGESEVTVIYSRNEVEAATKDGIHAKGLLQVNIPSSRTENSGSSLPRLQSGGQSVNR